MNKPFIEHQRLFLAVPLTEELIDECKFFINKCNNLNNKWVDADNWHVTSIFIGDFPVIHLESLKLALHGFCHSFPIFYIEFEEFIYFPKIKPTMIWGKFFKSEAFISFSKGLFVTISEFAGKQNFKINNSLHEENIPHITLSRLKRKTINLPALPEIRNNVLPLKIQKCQLYKSELLPNGAKYTLLYDFSLMES